MTTRLVVAYGGSVNGAAAAAALAAALGADWAALTLDLGQGIDLEQVRDQALASGARRAHVVDARIELAGRIVAPALTAGAFAAGPQAVAITRPVIAAHLVAVAKMEGAIHVAHGACGTDAIRLSRLIADLAPELIVHALSGEGGDDAPRIDQNVWGRTVHLGQAAALWDVVPADAFARTREADGCAAQPAVVEIAIKAGVPVAVNGVALEIGELIEVVDTIAGDHGVGRFDAKSATGRVLVEAPAAAVLSSAVSALAAASFDRTTLALGAQMSAAYAALIDEGSWNTKARAALDAFASATTGQLSGTVRLQLHGGICTLLASEVAVASLSPQ